MIPLNQRLKKVSTFIQGNCLADIGSDHAYLPIYAIENHLIDFAIAGEVIKGPFDASIRNVRDYKLSHEIDVRLGDGLTVIRPEDHVTSVSICGMGGPLIAKILNEGTEKLENKPRLILQSNIQSSAIREQLLKLNYTIIAEEILEEKVLQNKTPLFYKKWKREHDALLKIKSNLNPNVHTERLREIDKDINLINEVI